MLNNTKTTYKSHLFDNLSEADKDALRKCFLVKETPYLKNSYVIRMGDTVHDVFYLLSGRLHIVSEDIWGNQTLIETMHPQTLFGEAYVLSRAGNYIVSVIAATDSVVVRINPEKLMEECPKACSCHVQILKNIMRIEASKIVRLTEKLGHIAQRTMREKILSYLSKCAGRAKSYSFEIPYSRQELADYLCVDRSALSHELSRLSKEGILRYQKNRFELMDLGKDQFSS